MPRFSLVLLVLLGTLIVPALPARAADRCFPETQQCLNGRFGDYWEANGGLPVFGLPITSMQPELNRDTNRNYDSQWFERNRFERHPDNAAPYDVLLGRLGDDRLRQIGRDWRSEASKPNPLGGECQSFDVGGLRREVCGPFLQYWREHGLEFDGRRGAAYAESLALFGLPLTSPALETNSSGDTVLTQWFERARFEYHPNNPPAFNVLLGRLGSETRGGTAVAPAELMYTALGDSLAVGLFATGYAPRLRTQIEAARGTRVTLNNLGRNGWTSTALLRAVRGDANFRDAIVRAQIVTWDIGGNDFRDARADYRARRCGGSDNQNCLRSTLANFQSNWIGLLDEITALRAEGSLLRTMDIYNPFVAEDQRNDSWANDGGLSDAQVLRPYLDAANRHIATTSASKGVPVAPVFAAFNGGSGDEDPRAKGYLAFDGLHPNDEGHAVIAELFGSLGYQSRLVPQLQPAAP